MVSGYEATRGKQAAIGPAWSGKDNRKGAL
jgi:hypothetical protein